MHFDDEPGEYLAKRNLTKMVSLTCPDCRAVVTGKGDVHAAELLAIHQEGTCQGGKEVND